ncbi:hypothetical protein J2W39_000038 [Variovorax paradoxus]|uniref:DUF4381 domain-containing protein n=1 Tax=Variovorax paradoxus TaxID=34073 RepID=A0AAW8E8D5_VARPD|nr:hypothetical protein [Variovorax paradoxus]MDP9968815.1 hypothetical protein [Variovorax paradoxus]
MTSDQIHFEGSTPASGTQQPIAITIQMPPVVNPHWTAYVTAVATPIVAVLAAVLAGAIAYRNWRTAQNKLKLDLYERRAKVLATVRDTIESTVALERIDSGQLQEFMKAINDAEWLFDEKVRDYLRIVVFIKLGTYKASCDRFSEFRFHRANEGGMALDDHKRSTALEGERLSARRALANEMPAVTKMFAPFLKLSH